jgi:hypothetical protein
LAIPTEQPDENDALCGFMIDKAFIYAKIIKIFLAISGLALAVGLVALLPLFTATQPAIVQAASEPLQAASPSNTSLALDLQQQNALTTTLTPTEFLELGQFFTTTRDLTPVNPVLTIGSEVMTLTSLTDPFWSEAFLPAGVKLIDGEGDQAAANFFELINAEPPPKIQSLRHRVRPAPLFRSLLRPAAEGVFYSTGVGLRIP